MDRVSEPNSGYPQRGELGGLDRILADAAEYRKGISLKDGEIEDSSFYLCEMFELP